MSRFLERYMLILGCYAFVVPVVSLVHEFGHILAYWTIGITQFRLTINPFTTSFVEPLVHLPSEHMLYLATAGMVFQVMIFTVTWVALKSNTVPLLFPVQMCLPMSLLNIGGYLLATGIEGGDSAIMVMYGAPSLALNVLGLISVAIGLVTFACLLPNLGFSSDDPWRSILSPLFLGMETYSLLMLGYAYIIGFDLLIGQINVVSSMIFSGVILSLFMRLRLTSKSHPSSRDTLQVLGMGVIAISLCLVLS